MLEWTGAFRLIAVGSDKSAGIIWSVDVTSYVTESVLSSMACIPAIGASAWARGLVTSMSAQRYEIVNITLATAKDDNKTRCHEEEAR